MKRIFIYFFLIANLSIVIGFWLNSSGPLITEGGSSGVLIAFGRLTGLLAELLILTQLVLIGRIRVVEREFGFDKLNRLHRLIGYCWAIFIPLHPILLTAGYSQLARTSFWNQFYNFLTDWKHVSLAFVGLIILLGVIGISVSIVRRKLRYETWYFIHLLIYVAIALVFSHQIRSGDLVEKPAYYYWFALNFFIFGLVLLYRFIRPLYLAYKHEFRVEKIVPENDLINSVYITGKNLESFKYEAGQYAHITFLRKGMWYTHPFSFSVAPNGSYLRLSIKRLGDFTSQIQTIEPGTRIIIDGPFGVFTERKAKTDKFLFIAGGIGITPVYSLIESMSEKNKDMILLYGNKTPEEAAFVRELSEMNTKLYNVYSEGSIVGAESGYIDTDKITRLVPDVKNRDVYLCGPVPMMKGVVAALESIGVPKEQVHYERFAY